MLPKKQTTMMVRYNRCLQLKCVCLSLCVLLLNVTGAFAANITADQITAGVAQTYSGATTLENDGVTITFDTTNNGGTPAGADITFNGTVYSLGGTTTGMVVNSGTDGILTITNEIGDSGSLLSLSVTGKLFNYATWGGETNVNTQTYNCPVIDGSSIGSENIQETIYRSRTGGNIVFNDTVDAGLGYRRFRIITHGGRATLRGAVGGTTPFVQFKAQSEGGLVGSTQVYADITTFNSIDAVPDPRPDDYVPPPVDDENDDLILFDNDLIIGDVGGEATVKLTAKTVSFGTRVTFDLTGATTNDKLTVIGGVSLNNAILDLNVVNHSPAIGDSHILIDNDGEDPVTGTFSGLAEGGTILANGAAMWVVVAMT